MLDQITGVEIKQFIIKNADWGIYVYKSSENIIKENSITENSLGVIFTSKGYSINNIFYHNNFFNNEYNVYSSGGNYWFNSEINEGNYWDNYEGIDEKNDGIGDTPYQIPGGDDEDTYPWMHIDGKSKSKNLVNNIFSNIKNHIIFLILNKVFFLGELLQ